MEIIQHRGYPVEVHHVTTDDGYILELHRILSGLPSSRPVLLHHGILGTGAHWLMNPTDQALGIRLSASLDRSFLNEVVKLTCDEPFIKNSMLNIQDSF